MPSRKNQNPVEKIPKSTKTGIQKEKSKRTFFYYSETDLQKALELVKNGCAIATACNQYKVPRTTLRSKLRGKVPETTGRVGPESILGHHIEEKLEEWLLGTSRMGFPINRDFLIHSVKQLVDAEGLKNPFKNNIPGRKWFEGFLKRHPRVGQKRAEHLCKARAIVTESGIRSWFSHIAEELGENIKILDDPRRVFDMDETAVHLSPKGGLVLAERGKAVYDVAGNEKENVTTLFNVNAAGEFATSLTIFKYERLPKICVDSAPKGWGIGKSENGWMTSESFYEYFTNVFYPFLLERKIQLPVIVFLDGHVSHMSIHLSKFCKDKQIILCCFPPHSTHILQPLDVSFFFPLKQRWKNLIRNWRIQNDGVDVQKHNVPAFLSKLITEEDFTTVIKNGFKACGLCPFNANSVDYSKCVEMKDRENNQNISNEINSQRTMQQALSHQEYIESKINPELLQRFKNAKATGIDWETGDKHESLYNFWAQAVEDDKPENELQSPLCHPLVPENPSPLASHNDNVFEFPFPEFDASNLHEVDELLDSYPSDTLNQITDCEVPLAIEFPILVDNHKNPNIVIPPSDEVIQEPVVMEGIIEPVVEDVSTTNVSHLNSISMRRKSLDEVIDGICMWPKKKTTTRKRKVEHLPSVITADKWIELMEAKENEKSAEEERKKLKKIEREEKKELKKIEREENKERRKKIKEEKLEEKAKKKLAPKKSVKPRKNAKKN